MDMGMQCTVYVNREFESGAIRIYENIYLRSHACETCVRNTLLSSIAN